MAFVRVEQRNAHLAGRVRLHTVEGRDGPVSKATFTAISNTRWGGGGGGSAGGNNPGNNPGKTPGNNPGSTRGEEATAIQWTLWGKQAENAAAYLAKGSHINVVGRVQNNNYDKDGETVYTLAFTAEEVDYLDTKAEGEALRARHGGDAEPGEDGGGDSGGGDQPAKRAVRQARAGRATKAPGQGVSRAANHAAADVDATDAVSNHEAADQVV